MVTSRDVFREYIQFRSHAVVWMAAAWTVFALIGLITLVAASKVNVNRFGLALQLIGALALVPDVIGKEWLRSRLPMSKASAEADTVEESIPETGAPDTRVRAEVVFNYYQTKNLQVVVGNVFASLMLISILASVVLTPPPGSLPVDPVFLVMLAVLGFLWLNFYMLIHAQRLLRRPLSSGLVAWFIGIDLCVGFLGMVFAGVIHIIFDWLASGFRFIFQNGVRRVLLIITLPCFIVGLFFELFATWL